MIQTFRPHCIELSQALNVAHALCALRDLPGLACLDSASGSPANFSWIAWAPDPLPESVRSLADLGQHLREFETTGGCPGPFQGGFLGALGYELGVHGESLSLPEEPWGWPNLIGGIYTRFLVFDHRAQRTFLVVPNAQETGEIETLLANPKAPSPFGVGALKRHTPPAQHRQRIEQAREEIAAGDYYQVNLAHRFSAPMQGDPLDLYLRLRLANAAPYGAYLRFEQGACLSSSPELLVNFDGDTAFTRPIKGTAPRAADPEQDKSAREGLLASEKDRAELAMIVDLERNDLGRIAEPGSVRVRKFPELESYTRVHHLVATVEATPRPGIGSIQLLQALFPGGSITGAPKLASMEAIARLETEGRGLFTGSLGYLGFDGACCFNILIRTLLWRPLQGERGEISYRVGGGITHASDAHAEDQETLHKAQGMTDAWGAPE